MKGFWRKVLLTMGFAPLLFLLNEYYLKPKYGDPKPIPKIPKVVFKVEDHSSQPKLELKKLNQKVARKSAELIVLEEVQSFRRNIDKILPRLTTDQKKLAVKLLERLEECQNKDFCEMEKDEDGYFDESETHARKVQYRLLLLLNTAYKKEQNEELLLGSDVLKRLVQSGNERIVYESLIQLKAKKQLKETLGDLEGEGLTSAILILSKELEQEEIVALIENSLEMASSFTPVALFEKLDLLQFDQIQFLNILKRSCRFKEDLTHNWKAIKSLSESIKKKRNFKKGIEDTCY